MGSLPGGFATVLRAGRLIEVGDRLVDLATGLPAALSTRTLSSEAAMTWHTPVVELDRLSDGAEGLVDAWLAVDLLGRWLEVTLRVRSDPGDAGADPAALDRWLVGAAAVRAEGCVPVHLSSMAYVTRADPGRWPPLVVGVPGAARHGRLPPRLAAWIAGGGRCAALVEAPPVAAVDPAGLSTGALAARWLNPRARPRLRQTTRAWFALVRGKATTARLTKEERAASVTHMELLDIGAQLDEVRHDADALTLACRLARAQLQADHMAVIVRRGGVVVVLAADGTAADAAAVWPHACTDDGLPVEGRPGSPAAVDGMVSVTGWYAAVRQGSGDAAFWMGARWRSAEEGRTQAPLLTVFARLIAARVPPLPSPAVPAGPGLEDTLVGDSLVMRDVRAQIALAARAPFPVLIRGESGCGKELAARAIHALGTRRHRRCAAINCAALPDDLIESELFGHVRGAFTGAATDRPGLFDDADGGTLFLDEVGELGGRAQAKLLRVLQDGEVRRVGENHARRVDVRVIAATNVSLEDAVRHGTFRADLFYRLDVVRVRMPALRERRADIPLLARHFWRECTARVGSRARLEGRVLDALARYDWPGNVRQLQNTLAALAVRVPPRGRVQLDDLPPELTDSSRAGDTRGGLDAARREFEAHFVRDALTRAGGRPTMAARDLGVTRQGLSKLVRRLGLDPSAGVPRLP